MPYSNSMPPREPYPRFWRPPAAQRYLKTSIVIITNRSAGEWCKILGDTTVAAAMLDRLLHRSVVITLDGASYRLRHHATAADELRRVTTGTNLR